MKKAVFYTDQPNNETVFDDEFLRSIINFLGVDEITRINAEPVTGFQSGVEWGDLAQDGVAAVVLYDANDACVFGISLEAGTEGISVYEFFEGKLWRLSDLVIAGKKPVSWVPPKKT